MNVGFQNWIRECFVAHYEAYGYPDACCSIRVFLSGEVQSFFPSGTKNPPPVVRVPQPVLEMGRDEAWGAISDAFKQTFRPPEEPTFVLLED